MRPCFPVHARIADITCSRHECVLLQRIARSTAFSARHGNGHRAFLYKTLQQSLTQPALPNRCLIMLYLASVLQVLRLHRRLPALTLLCLQGSVLHEVLLIYVANTIKRSRGCVPHNALPHTRPALCQGPRCVDLDSKGFPPSFFGGQMCWAHNSGAPGGGHLVQLAPNTQSQAGTHALLTLRACRWS